MFGFFFCSLFGGGGGAFPAATEGGVAPVRPTRAAAAAEYMQMPPTYIPAPPATPSPPQTGSSASEADPEAVCGGRGGAVS